MPKLGDLGGSMSILRELREKLVEGERTREVEEERWGTFSTTASKIAQACDSRDLESLAGAARELKNRLRRPAVRKELARLESKEEDDDGDGGGDDKSTVKDKGKIPAKSDKNPTGECKCAQCGKTIDGSREPCVEDALCTHCALKNKVIPKDKQNKKKTVLPGVDTGDAGTQGGEQGGGQGDGQDGGDKKESRTFLRRRGYLS